MGLLYLLLYLVYDTDINYKINNREVIFEFSEFRVQYRHIS
jgi:hypothetical protein